MSEEDKYLSLIGQKAIAWEQALESGDRNQMLDMRNDFEDFRRSLPPNLPFQIQKIIESYDNIFPRPPQFRP